MQIETQQKRNRRLLPCAGVHFRGQHVRVERTGFIFKVKDNRLPAVELLFERYLTSLRSPFTIFTMDAE